MKTFQYNTERKERKVEQERNLKSKKAKCKLGKEVLSEELGLHVLLKGREGRPCSGSARQFVPPTTTLNISCVIVTLIVTLQLHPGERERDTVLVAQVSALGMGS